MLRVLQTGPQVRDIAFDPEGRFVASVTCNGTVQVNLYQHCLIFSFLAFHELACKPGFPDLVLNALTVPLHSKQVWDVSNGKAVFTLKHGAPVTDHFSPERARLAWHPDGSVLAVPGIEVPLGLHYARAAFARS